MTTKAAIVEEICLQLAIEPFKLSAGGTEPKEFLVAVACHLGVIGTMESDLTKPELAELILKSFGVSWKPEYSSSGSTVTKQCLTEMLNLVIFKR